MSAIRAAVTPPKPGSLHPLKELEALMQRKDLTALEAQRAQILMKDYGTGVPRQQSLTTHIEPLAMASEPPMSCAPDISSGSTDTLSSGHKSEIGSDAPTFGMELEMRTRATPHLNMKPSALTSRKFAVFVWTYSGRASGARVQCRTRRWAPFLCVSAMPVTWM